MRALLRKPKARRALERGLGWLAILLLVLLVGAEAWARVGGGSSFSGGSHGGGSHGGGGGGGDGDGLFFLIWLCIEYPAIGIPLAICVAIVVVVKKMNEGKREEWETASSSEGAWMPPVPTAMRNGRKRLATIRALDPDFSVAVFEDFLYALYSKVHELRGAGQIEQLTPYLSQAARSQLRRPAGLAEVNGIIVASMRTLALRGVAPDSAGVGISVLFESNYTEVCNEAGRERQRTWYAVERWELSRKAGARSRTPDKARKIGCPSCGAALTAIRGNTCSYCQKIVDTGEFDWHVDLIQVLRLEEKPALFTTTVAEEGTSLPTVVDLDVQADLAALVRKDPEFAWEDFRARAEMIFVELQTAWSERDWMRVRPFVSDSLFQSQLAWIEGFKQRHLRNVIERPTAADVHLASILSDEHFDAITVRMLASCIDYVISEDGSKLLSGNKSRPRRFTEYWTFIRGAKRSGRPGTEPKCPNCGAPLQINQAGTCDYCQAKVTSGQFDWVLSRIEQDEAYTG